MDGRKYLFIKVFEQKLESKQFIYTALDFFRSYGGGK